MYHTKAGTRMDRDIPISIIASKCALGISSKQSMSQTFVLCYAVTCVVMFQGGGSLTGDVIPISTSILALETITLRSLR